MSYQILCTQPSPFSPVSLNQQFSTFSSYGTYKLITHILWHTKNVYFLADLNNNNKTGIILNYSQWTAIIMLAVVIFYLII